MARRTRVPIETADLDDRALERRLRNLWLGSAPFMAVDSSATEKAVAETIAAADNRKASLSDRVANREDLLRGMGRLDRARRHCDRMDAERDRWEREKPS